MRSQSSNNSSSSSLTTSTAQPASLNATSAARICAAAPTSTPQVGCETINSLGLASISRPTMNFCKLPPDKDWAGACGPPAFTWYFAMMFCACADSSGILIQPEPLTASLRVSNRLCDRLKVGTAPRPSRSSGTKCKPSALRCKGPWFPTACPLKRMLSEVARVSSPLKAYSNSR